MEKTSEKIVEYIAKRGQASGKELSEFLNITDRAVRKQLHVLFRSGKLGKVGKPPKVFYIVPSRTYTVKVEPTTLRLGENKVHMSHLSAKNREIIENNFLYITPKGERFDGLNGFVRWCENRALNTEDKVVEYVGIYKKYHRLQKDGVVSAKKKIKDTFHRSLCLDDVFYADFYAWEVFGKTKLGQLLLYGKQSQNRRIMMEVSESIGLSVNSLITKYGIDAVGFIPPTVKRELQFMRVLEKELNITLPIIKIEKVKTEIITPQKTLSNLRDRIDNAEHSIFVTDARKFSNILVIDDAVGSGATMNQVACKVKRAGIAKKVYGFAVTGSVKGFDVIREV